jgi:hypothetical protein
VSTKEMLALIALWFISLACHVAGRVHVPSGPLQVSPGQVQDPTLVGNPSTAKSIPGTQQQTQQKLPRFWSPNRVYFDIIHSKSKSPVVFPFAGQEQKIISFLKSLSEYSFSLAYSYKDSKIDNSTYFYFNMIHNTLPILNTATSVVVNAKGHLQSYYFSNVKKVGSQAQPKAHISATQAVQSAGRALGRSESQYKSLAFVKGLVTGDAKFYSVESIHVKLGYYALKSGVLELVYELRIKDIKISWYEILLLIRI